MIITKRVTEVPFENVKVRDLSLKRRNKDSNVELDGDRGVLRVTRTKIKKGKNPSLPLSKYPYNIFRFFSIFYPINSFIFFKPSHLAFSKFISVLDN